MIISPVKSSIPKTNADMTPKTAPRHRRAKSARWGHIHGAIPKAPTVAPIALSQSARQIDPQLVFLPVPSCRSQVRLSSLALLESDIAQRHGYSKSRNIFRSYRRRYFENREI